MIMISFNCNNFIIINGTEVLHGRKIAFACNVDEGNALYYGENYKQIPLATITLFYILYNAHTKYF